MQHDPAVQHFRIDVGDFDALNVTVLRVGNNLTYPRPDGSLGTWGHGIRGTLLLKRGGECPDRPSTLTQPRYTDQPVKFDLRTNVTVYASRFFSESFCTTGATSGTYRFAVFADDIFGPLDGMSHPTGTMQVADAAPTWVTLHATPDATTRPERRRARGSRRCARTTCRAGRTTTAWG